MNAARPRTSRGPSQVPLAVAVVVVVLVIAAGAVGLVTGWVDDDDGDVLASTSDASPGADDVEPAPPEDPEAGAPPPEEAAAPLVLRVEGGRSYVRVETPDGEVLEEAVLPDGTTRTYEQPALDVRLGNAGAVVYSTYGAPEQRAGGSGEVLDVTVRPPG